MTELGDAFKEMRRQRREAEEPKRKAYAADQLTRAGWTVHPGPDEWSFTVHSPRGTRFNFWPFSGWFAGPIKGRGVHRLIRDGGKV